jgi:hypothetical protein
MADPTGVSFAQATEQLADSLDNIQSSLASQINKLASDINTLADSSASSTSDVAGGALPDGVKDGDVVRLQYKINAMEKAAESGAATFTKAEGISKQVVRTLAGG